MFLRGTQGLSLPMMLTRVKIQFDGAVGNKTQMIVKVLGILYNGHGSQAGRSNLT